MSYKYPRKNAIGIDLGGTNIRVGLVDSFGKILTKKSELTKKEFGPRAVINQMIELAESILPERKKILGIGIGAPGPLDQRRGLIFFTPNLPGWKKKCFSVIQKRI